jgi:hypothetical protein
MVHLRTQSRYTYTVRHVSVAATTIIGEGNAFRKCLPTHGKPLYFARAFNAELFMSHSQVCTGVVRCTVLFGVPVRRRKLWRNNVPKRSTQSIIWRRHMHLIRGPTNLTRPLFEIKLIIYLNDFWIKSK